ncbi:hypothetical protein HELRODRAFT_188784 [Helobdella robusta]|uniref:Myosin VIIa n=1 Tax=Helobdella robusta TaxID=6412 RepID=T1FQC8_HELRO|nr:hypothetical protein HELRODRAFT_188784 [Helobdella robusta]ESO02636.1 hypothetical protein HELRODRAFT_188784 [Helobdella robusta]
MVLINKDDWVWIEPQTKGEFDVAVGGVVKKCEADSYLILDDDNKEVWVRPPQKVNGMHPTSVKGVEDMIQLGDLNEAGILRNLFMRYNNGDIYTYTGSILVALNPYKVLPIYAPEDIQRYKDKKIGELPPHIFAIGDNSYHNMRRYLDNQCIIISGESGAGKTESTKLILQFLAAVSGQHSWIEQQILEANPVMEAFGNAKTVRNDNSSRFGKYIDIYFNSNGSIEGAKIEQYLLEKSRIVGQNRDERNYHIFYCMLAGLSSEEKQQLQLTRAEDYHYLTQGNCVTCEGREDASDFSEVRAAMKVLTYTEDEINIIMKILAALLHLGNVTYKGSMVKNIEAAEIVGTDNIQSTCTLLELNPQELSSALVTKTISMRGENVKTTLGVVASVDVRDAFVKGIYGRMFIWIITKINEAIFVQASKDSKHKKNSIGVLDIFGFENFEKNSFEQLCINYANENLQQFFVQHIFKLEQEEYDNEGINWSRIEFVDNQDVLDLIAVRPLNIFALVDEESKFPQGTDATMLSKLNQNHSKNTYYCQAKSDNIKNFAIIHFAGIMADSRKRMQTLGSQFKKSLDLLMKTLGSCQPFFVRCIKPNELKKPMIFDRTLCVRQLRYSGMMETITIRRKGYPIRHTFAEFVDRYRILVSGIGVSTVEDCKAASDKICSAVLQEADYQLGKTKVFLKDAQDAFLEQERDRVLTYKLVTIQKCVKGWSNRNKFKKTVSSCVTVQKFIRCFQAKQKYNNMKYGYSRLQALVRSRELAQQFSMIRRKMIAIQRYCSGFLFSHLYQKKLKGVVVLQAGARCLVARRQYYRMKFQNTKRLESEKQRELDEKQLEKKLGKAEAKKEAERLHMMEQEEARMKADILSKKSRIDDALLRNRAPVNDNEVINEMFDITDTMTNSNGVGTNFQGFQPLGDQRYSESTMDLSSIHLPLPDDDNEDISDYKFAKFAATYFQNNATTTFIKKSLKKPLLPVKNEGDEIAALSVWITILRFMGDLPDIKYVVQGGEARDNTPVMTKIFTTLGRKFNQRDIEEAQRMGTDIENNINTTLQDGRRTTKASKKMVSMTLRKKSKITEEVSNQIKDGEFVPLSNALLDDKPMSNLEKLHFIIGNGILRPDLRPSSARGWILLSLCVGCFAPTENFVKYLRCFIKEGPLGYAPYCEERLRRTFANGPRNQPPSWLELQATKSKKPLILPITFMDGNTKTLYADSATTAKELCQQLSAKINLKDQFGFSLYIALFDKVSSLGSGGDHVMDAISQCEQYAKEQGAQERNAPWRLFFRKEIFAPWHDPAFDKMATELIYQQIVRGIKFGEYRCDKEDDLATIAAQQFYIEFGPIISVDRLAPQVQHYIPDMILMKNSAAWVNKIVDSFNKSYFINKQYTADRLKQDVVNYAKFKWPLLFSRFYEAYKFAGPSLPKNDVIIAVNWTGVYVVDETEKVLLELSYPEITAVSCSRTGKIHGQSFTLATLSGDEYTFTSPNAEDIRDLVVTFLDGLKKKSKFVVVLQDYKPPSDDPSFLTLKKGDLITLKTNGESAMTTGWCSGTSNSSQKSGDFPAECVYILPCITKPTVDILKMFMNKPQNMYNGSDSGFDDSTLSSSSSSSSYSTLETYSFDHFRPPPKKTLTKTIATIRRKAEESLWRHSTQPLKGPLLKKLLNDEELYAAACDSFLTIMKYAGDHPSKQVVPYLELYYVVFKPAIDNDSMKDEIYCQVVKQLTFNRNPASEKIYWQLLWLLSGSFAPSTNLCKELKSFLECRTTKINMASFCLTRLNKIIKSGSRKHPPHPVEIKASQMDEPIIKQRILFPDETDVNCVVDSNMYAKELCESLAEQLKLKTAEGFSLFIKMADKVISIPEGDFFFDFVQHLTEWVNKSKGTMGTGTQFNYQVFFMKKLWSSTVPGYDVNADVRFHYYQELPKLLLGYHKCTVDDALKLAGFITAVKYSSKPDALASLGAEKLLKETIPINLHKSMSNNEWQNEIQSAFKDCSNMPEKEAKVAFLKQLYYWPTFGSAFFDIKQSTDSSLPKNLLMAINKQGVNLIDPNSKDILATYPFTKISNWSSGASYFHMTIGSLVKGNKLLCETVLGYKMDDLLTSYIGLMLASVKNKTIKKERL